MNKEDLQIVKENKKLKEYNDILNLEIARMNLEIQFLTKRENKLKKIERIFKSGTVDLEELSYLVRGRIWKRLKRY